MTPAELADWQSRGFRMVFPKEFAIGQAQRSEPAVSSPPNEADEPATQPPSAQTAQRIEERHAESETKSGSGTTVPSSQDAHHEPVRTSSGDAH